MTARALFPPAIPDIPGVPVAVPAPTDNDSAAQDAETRLTAATLALWQDGAVAQADAAARLCAAFGTGPGNAVAAALHRLWCALPDGAPPPRPDALAHLVAATLIGPGGPDGPEGEDTARQLALGIVPAHQMEPLVIAARGLALALRRAVLVASGPTSCAVSSAPSGPPGCPVRHR